MGAFCVAHGTTVDSGRCPTPVGECIFTEQAGGPHSQVCSVSRQSQVGDQQGGNRQRLYVTSTQPAAAVEGG